MLKKSYNKLFSSRTKLTESIYNLEESTTTCRGEDSQNRTEPDEAKKSLVLPALLKAPVQKRTRSNSPSIFAIKEERVRTSSDSGNRRSSLITMENKNLSAVRKLSSGNVKVSSLDSNNNNFLSVGNHAGRNSHSDM